MALTLILVCVLVVSRSGLGADIVGPVFPDAYAAADGARDRWRVWWATAGRFWSEFLGGRTMSSVWSLVWFVFDRGREMAR